MASTPPPRAAATAAPDAPPAPWASPSHAAHAAAQAQPAHPWQPGQPPPLASPAGLPERFQLLRPLGQGSAGTVYAAWDQQLQTHLALKLVQPLPYPARFVAEARSACSLQHPDIVATLAAGHAPGLGWLAMELVPGVPLQRYTQAARLLPEALALHAAARVAGALAHAHALGVVHRDVKPANVLVHWPSALCKLGDFGLARQADSEATRTGLVMGSPAYMAPELLAGAAPSARSDLYALGVSLFELLTARLPFSSSNLGELLRQVAQQPAPRLQALRPDLPAGWTTQVESLLSRLLAKHPAQRPASAAELVPALQQLSAAAGGLDATAAGSAKTPGQAPTPRAAAREHPPE